MDKKLKWLFIAILVVASPIAVAQTYGAYRVGSGISITPRTAAPMAASGQGVFWIKSTDSNTLHYTNPAGSDSQIGSGGSLSAAYSAGGTGPQVIDEDGTRLDVQFQKQSAILSRRRCDNGRLFLRRLRDFSWY